MRYLADENIPLETIETLIKEGIEILSVSKLFSGASDEEIIKLAQKEKRVIITFDKDFGEWIFLKKIKPLVGIILLRINTISVDYITAKIKQVLSKDISFSDHFVVVNDDKIRVVPL